MRLGSRNGPALLAVGATILGLASGVAILGGMIQPAADVPHAAVTSEALAAHLARSPQDGRAWLLLARLEFEADRFQPAADAYAKGLAASPRAARDPALWCEYADALGMTQGGSLEGRPRALIEQALALDARHPKALEMAGSAAFARGDYASAQRYWRALLAQLPESSPAYRELAAAIARAGRLGLGS